MVKYDVIYDYRFSKTYTGPQKEIIRLAKMFGRERGFTSMAVYFAGTTRVVGRWERKENSSRWNEVF